MKYTLKAIDEAIELGALVDNKLHFVIRIEDNKTYNIAKEYVNFVRKNILEEAVKGIENISLTFKDKLVTLDLTITSDYKGGKEDND